VQTLFGRKTNIPPALVNDLLLQLALASKRIRLEAMSGTPVSSGRSRSIVFKAWYDNRNEPLVVKLAAAGKASQEGRNYHKYIEDNLGGHFHAVLRRPPVIFWDVGAVLYTFVGAPRRALESFEEFYRRQTDPERILQPLEHFFGEVWGNFYQRGGEALKGSLYCAYDEALSIARHVKKFSKEEKINFQGIAAQLPHPAAWVQRHHEESLIPGASQAIIHGDLHGNNLFVDEEHAWAIDFERSGPGPILRDFAELEVNIAARLFPPTEGGDLSDLFRLAVLSASLKKPAVTHLQEAELLRGDGEAQKAFGVIRGLHELACTLIKDFDEREYLWALLCDALYSAAHAAQGNPRRERALLYGAVICERLERWGEDWPPKSWLHNLPTDRLDQAYDQ
jgi:hypothetical protein